MSALIPNPFTLFPDLAGRPLDNGKIYIGQPNLDPKDHPIEVYWDQELTIAAVQPIPTLGGLMFNDNAPGMIYADVDDYSVRVLDKNGRQVFFVQSILALDSNLFINNLPDALIKVQQPFTGAVPRNQHDKNADMLSVRDFGVTGNGVDDDSVNLQKAVNAAAGQKKILFFPAGNYRLNSFLELPSSTHWRGEAGTKLFLDPGMTLGATIGGTARAIYANNAVGMTLENIEFYSAPETTKPITIAMVGTTGIKIQNCLFRDFGNPENYSQGLILYDSSDIRVTNSAFNGCSGDGMALSNLCNNFYFSGNEFTGNGDWGLAISIGCERGMVQGNFFLDNTSTATGADRSHDIVFADNICINNEHGIRVCQFANTAELNHSITITGNVIRNANVAGISVENVTSLGMVTVAGNVVGGSSNQGIRVVDAFGCTITGNSIYSIQGDAILFNAQTEGLETGRSTVIGNKISTCTYGIRQLAGAGTSSKLTLMGNSMTECSVTPLSTINADFIDSDLNPDYFTLSKALGFPSGIYSGTANTGGITPPTSVWGYIPVYIGGALKKIPVYNP